MNQFENLGIGNAFSYPIFLYRFSIVLNVEVSKLRDEAAI